MKHLVQLLIVREKDGNGEILKMMTDDGNTVFEHIIGKDDKLKWLFAIPVSLSVMAFLVFF